VESRRRRSSFFDSIATRGCLGGVNNPVGSGIENFEVQGRFIALRLQKENGCAAAGGA
jgi:hypothetical protein